MPIDPFKIISQFYDSDSELFAVLVEHSTKVAAKSLEIAKGLAHLHLDMDFIEKAAMLHDIGIFKTRSQEIGCAGKYPYVCHGYLGRELLDGLGLPRQFGLVSERHTGAGITLENIIEADLPLPHRDMVPVTLEEKIICCADKFYSKSPKKRDNVMTRQKIEKSLAKLNLGHAKRFSAWADEFGIY
ncbi:phosphohydrolase [Desulfobacter hydrogenophilus]|uniref:HDIG domain-containing protein n=1 Tax=Desulfobacter hydrogenophilus TaxID=2291 RepID=A0A328FIX7_9BACT|nr:HD domain-containing protein [Desulfobacter hydrogenophilus]NDY71369.1 HDIG domain-containing protein [Desulfobacter hydrogenophilus]QBH12233.1 HDIG domain-containing protein [Desulfobacter hydrogenophilus]RAM03442.1 phosphohydrolase [Desulfobacter hydrogenophilus]